MRRHPLQRYALTAFGTVPLAVCIALFTRQVPQAQAIIDVPHETLAKECAVADNIAVLRIEKVNREKKAIVYRKVRDLKGAFPAPFKFVGETFTHVLGPLHNPEYHRHDIANQDLQNDAVLARAAEGKLAVVFDRGGGTAICLGHAWYTVRGRPPAEGHWVVAGSADSRMQRLFCGEVDEWSKPYRASWPARR